MPLSVEFYCVSIEDIRAATEQMWGLYRTRAVVAGLPSVDGPKTGGRARKLFRASDILLRCRNHPRWFAEFETNLLNIIKNKEFPNEA